MTVRKIEARLPKGMRDYPPLEMIRRAYVIDKVAAVFRRFGYEPLQTPVMELEETLKGKYGDDAERLIYYAQHPGSDDTLALRYDLTVPLARFYGMHEGKLTLPFRRYQIAPVWRAERPQRGRYREFYQCDADIIGVNTQDADAEGVNIVVTALRELGLEAFVVKLNNRKILTGMGIYAGLEGEPLASLYRIVDKLDKIGLDGVEKELIQSNLPIDSVKRIMSLLAESSQNAVTGYLAAHRQIASLREALDSVPQAMEGLQELEVLLDFLEASSVPGENISVDASMVRGLSYYTGSIYETVLISDDPEERVGSVSGGGRYDDLLGLFAKNTVPTVGISLGIERLFVLLDNRNLYPAHLNATVVRVLVTVFSAETRTASMRLAAMLRQAEIPTELAMTEGKLGRQIGYADKKGIPVVAVLGPDEIAADQVKLKFLRSGEETAVSLSAAVETIKGYITQ